MTTLDDPAEQVRRRVLLGSAHMRPLARFAASLRLGTGRHVPDADPLDGGTDARVLLILETPGPSVRSTGFVSRDNPTPTSANIRRFTAASGLRREDTVIWNAVPWTIHAEGARNRAPRAAEIRDGLALLPALLDLLHRLRCAVLAGRVAGYARAIVEKARPDLLVIPVPHPSPTIVCTDPRIGAAIRDGFTRAVACLDGDAA